MTWSMDMTSVYNHAENVITSMMPLVTLIGGLSLGFVVISKITSAFR